MVAHVPRSGLFIRTLRAPRARPAAQLSHSSAASGCWGRLKAWLKEQPPLPAVPGAVILGRELDRHLANQRLGPRLLLLVFDDVRRRRDPFFPFLYERADGGGEDGAHEPAARAVLQVRGEHLAPRQRLLVVDLSIS
jgi:hypothetical protein